MRLNEIHMLVEKEIKTEINANDVVVLIDPMPRRLVVFALNSKFKQVRGLIAGQHLFFWDSYYATHDEMARALGVDYHLENRAHVWVADGEVRVDFLDRAFGDFPDMPAMERLLMSDVLFFDGRSAGYVSGPELLELIK